MLRGVTLCVTKDVFSVDALRLADDQATLIHFDLLVLSHLSKLLIALVLLLVILSLSSTHLSKLLVGLLSELTMLRLLVLTRHRQLSRLSEIMGLVLWRKLERLHLLLSLKRSSVLNVDLVGGRVGVSGGCIGLMLHLSLVLLLSEVASLVPVLAW